MKTKRIVGALGASLALLLTACGSDARPATAPTTKVTEATKPAADTTPAPVETSAPEVTTAETTAVEETTPVEDTTAPESGLEGEGELNIIVWAGYAEDGSTDPAVDWVTPFEDETGCAVNVKLGNSSDEMVQLMQTGEYDGVSASGDATTRLIEGGEVAEIDTDLIPNYADVFEGLKLKPWNSVDGVAYGVPHGRRRNLLVYNTEAFPTAPDSLSVMFEADSPAAGGVSVYDSAIYIADAAIYLMATQPDLGITNPYALDQTQFDAALALLGEQEALAGQYWALYTDQQAELEAGTVVAGTTWQVIVNLAQGNDAKIDATKPKEGATGWSDTWMLSSKAKHPNCMLMWMNHIISPWQRSGCRVVR